MPLRQRRAKLFSLYLFLPFHYNNQVVMLLFNSFLSITTNLIPFNARSAVTIRWRSLHGIIQNTNIPLAYHNKKIQLVHCLRKLDFFITATIQFISNEKKYLEISLYGPNSIFLKPKEVPFYLLFFFYLRDSHYIHRLLISVYDNRRQPL